MSRGKVFDYFDQCASAALSKEDDRSFLLGSIGIRSDGRIVRSLNSMSMEPQRQAHSEYRLASKLDRGAKVYVARVKRQYLQLEAPQVLGVSYHFGMARPCPDCYKVLKYAGVSKCYYTISNNEYGVIHFD